MPFREAERERDPGNRGIFLISTISRGSSFPLPGTPGKSTLVLSSRLGAPRLPKPEAEARQTNCLLTRFVTVALLFPCRVGQRPIQARAGMYALSKVTPTTSFPRKRESTASGVDPCFRGGDDGLLFGWVGRRPMTTRNKVRIAC